MTMQKSPKVTKSNTDQIIRDCFPQSLFLCEISRKFGFIGVINWVYTRRDGPPGPSVDSAVYRTVEDARPYDLVQIGFVGRDARRHAVIFSRISARRKSRALHF